MGLDIYFHKTTIPFEGEQTSNKDISNFTDKVDALAKENLGKKIEKLLEPLRNAWKEIPDNDYWRNIYNERYFTFVEKLRPLIAKNFDFKIHPYTKAVLDLPELEEQLKKEVEMAYEPYDAYFRKSNFIFYYFESTIGTMQDEWFAFVRPEDVDDIIDRCERVLRNHGLAHQLLPTQSGFFFGSTDYDDWYFEQVKDCLKQMKKYRKLLKDGVTGYVIFSW
jgi:hypothetical protein